MTGSLVIVGGGLAAQRACEALRAAGHDGPIRMICEEPVAPYDRPPLSKELLAGTAQADDLALRPAAWHSDNDVELLLGERAVALHPAIRRVELASGEHLPYDRLLIATGSAPRTLPGLEGRANVHTLRTLADALALRTELRPGARLAVVGAGFIGQEIAATARGLGVEVTLVEAAPTPLGGLLGPVLGGWFAALHEAEGVDVRLGTHIDAVRGNGRIEELVLSDGARVACDAVVVGVGVAPATAWLAGSGLEPDGVHVDAAGRTRLPGVFSAGDAAREVDPRTGAIERCEHWEAAARSGTAAGRAMLGLEPRPAPSPSFWSDQYGVRIQAVGHLPGADGMRLDGELHSRDFTALLTRGERVTGALLVGRPRDLPRVRKLITETDSDTDTDKEQAA